MISVIIPLYNKERQIADTLRSVFAQTYDDYEVVVVDDGSTDGSAAVVAAVSDTRIRLIHQSNAGVSAARNRGIAEARGELIALLDADDEWKPDYLATQMRLVSEYPQCDVFATNYEFRNERGEVTPTIIRRLPFTTESGVLTNYFDVAAHSNPPICSISIMARKSALEAVGGFPIGVVSGEDLLTWARLACRYQMAWTNSSQAI
jgi:glycosyltransferase involved in cell wall biosynthesis